MITASFGYAPTPGGASFTKIYDEHGKHISTRDSCMGIEWPTLADDEEVQDTPAEEVQPTPAVSAPHEFAADTPKAGES
ncbi:hypothetical protein XfCFBP7969_11325 [Xylella fastidiosa subsp. fastidiosa]|uniref:hypothetical protein n=1 Tax=Xylella fastidiosa TaxID=2371 RepID=UPI000FFE5756|nr:hypothetical protein [Xylella fastidiosa]RWA32159.1 hypothetical protein XfCFBP7969_11325 [Xylella fastidiosa subsp. fastidiosa]